MNTEAKDRIQEFKKRMAIAANVVCEKHGSVLPDGHRFCLRCHPKSCGIHGGTLGKYESCPECSGSLICRDEIVQAPAAPVTGTLLLLPKDQGQGHSHHSKHKKCDNNPNQSLYEKG